MNPVLQLLLTQPWVGRLGWTLLHFVWQGALIAFAFAVVRARMRRPQTRYLLGCAVLAVIIAAPLATFAYIGSPRAAATALIREGTLSGGTIGLQPFGTWQADGWAQVLPWLVTLWLAGVFAFLVRLSGGWLMTAHLRTAGNRPASDEWQQTLERLAGRIGLFRPVKFLISSRVEAPMVIGWLRPVVLMPIGVLTGLPREHVEALLAHELAHIRRHDYVVNVIQSIAEAVLFYHPAVWWVSAQIRSERELCCDDAAVAAGGDALTYARALTNFESCRPAHVRAALTATGGSLRSRIRRVLAPTDPVSDMLPGPGAGWALAVLVLVGICAVATLPIASAQEPVVEKAAIWSDTVKLGDMQRSVRGLGVLTTATAAQVKIAESQAREIAPGQPAFLGFRGRPEVAAGHVARIQSGVTNGTVTVDVQVDGSLPPGISAPEQVDGRIDIERLANVVYVGRPVFGQAESEITLFKLEPDGKSAVRTKVQLGRSSVNVIEVRGGLQPGDRVIVSDMSAYKNVDRVTLR